jgi:hypothetical protein
MQRTLLHLAVLDNRLDVIQGMKDRSLLKKRDAYNLSPIDLAHLLQRREILAFWQEKKIDSLLFDSKEDLDAVLRMTAKAKRKDRIASEKIWLGVYFDREIALGLHPPVSIRKIDEQIGLGVFAEKAIAPCAFVGEYTGRVLHKKRVSLEGKRYCVSLASAWGKTPFSIDGEGEGNFTRYINHAAKPNLGLQSVYWRGLPRMLFFALKAIRQGEQLTFDYGDKYWNDLAEKPRFL